MARRRPQARPAEAIPEPQLHTGAGRPGRRRAAIGRPRLVGWSAAAIALVALAFIVGRPAGEQGLLAGSPPPTPTAPRQVVFGTALDAQTNVALGDTNRFRSGDPFAYSVTLESAPGTDSIWVEIVRQEVGGNVVVQEASVQRILPDAPTFAFAVRTDDLLAAWGAGDFEMRIYLDPTAAPLAVGTFSLVAVE